MDKPELSNDEIIDAVLARIAEPRFNMFYGHGVRLPDHPGVDKNKIHEATRFLKTGRFIKEKSPSLVLDERGQDAMKAGGYIAYIRAEQEDKDLDRRLREANIKSTVWSRNHGRINIALTTIAIVISVIGMYQATMAGKDRIKSDRAVAHADSVLQVTKAEREKLHWELIEVRALVDELRAKQDPPVDPVPPPVGKSKAR